VEKQISDVEQIKTFLAARGALKWQEREALAERNMRRRATAACEIVSLVAEKRPD
jgi:hypothetical protein